MKIFVAFRTETIYNDDIKIILKWQPQEMRIFSIFCGVYTNAGRAENGLYHW